MYRPGCRINHLFAFKSLTLIATPKNIQEIDLSTGAVFLVNKPLRMTSFFVVDRIKRAIWRSSKQKIKIGHAGTLDPLASGLLILCTGRMTKKIDDYQAREKHYTGHFTLGASTPSYDLETEVIEFADPTGISLDALENCRKSFLGYQELVPPAHSAVKIGGKRAYTLARNGEEVVLAAKPIYISEMTINTEHFPRIGFSIHCTKGTYIRSIAHEFGRRLGNAAYLSALTRQKIGEYALEDAWELDELIKILNPFNPPLEP